MTRSSDMQQGQRKRFDKTSLYRLLTNVAYVGKVRYREGGMSAMLPNSRGGEHIDG